jgi:hypothetical protein
MYSVENFSLWITDVSSSTRREASRLCSCIAMDLQFATRRKLPRTVLVRLYELSKPSKTLCLLCQGGAQAVVRPRGTIVCKHLKPMNSAGPSILCEFKQSTATRFPISSVLVMQALQVVQNGMSDLDAPTDSSYLPMAMCWTCNPISPTPLLTG